MTEHQICCICNTEIKDKKQLVYNETNGLSFHFGCMNYEIDRQELCTHEAFGGIGN